MPASLCSISNIENIKLFVNTEFWAMHKITLWIEDITASFMGDNLKLIKATQILAEKSECTEMIF